MAKNAVVVTGEYTNKNGDQKKNYLTIGRLMDVDNGQYMSIFPWVNLAGIPKNKYGEITVNFYDEKPREAKEPAKANGYAPGADEPDDQIPFN